MSEVGFADKVTFQTLSDVYDDGNEHEAAADVCCHSIPEFSDSRKSGEEARKRRVSRKIAAADVPVLKSELGEDSEECQEDDPKLKQNVVHSITVYNRLRKKQRFNTELVSQYGKFSTEALLKEYHNNKKLDKKTKAWLKEEIFLKVFFLLPYALKKSYHVSICNFDDAIQNMASSVLVAIEMFNPNLNYTFVNYLVAYIKSGAAKTFRDMNLVVVPPSKRKELKENDEEACLPGYYSYDDGYRSSGQSNVYTTCTPSEDFDEIVHNIQLVEWLEDSISKECGLLNDDERRVLILHYGLFGTQPQPYKEIAKLRRAEGRGFACSRLSQISTQAKKKLSAYFAEIGLEEY